DRHRSPGKTGTNEPECGEIDEMTQRCADGTADSDEDDMQHAGVLRASRAWVNRELLVPKLSSLRLHGNFHSCGTLGLRGTRGCLIPRLLDSGPCHHQPEIA